MFIVSQPSSANKNVENLRQHEGIFYISSHFQLHLIMNLLISNFINAESKASDNGSSFGTFPR